jgi:hypothetical protein
MSSGSGLLPPWSGLARREIAIMAIRIIGRFIGTLALLVVEVMLTMLVYTFLNLKFVDTFGYLVRQSRTVLDWMGSLLLTLMPGSANAAYATLLGELGPKAILLLLIGLVVAAIMRSLVELTGLARPSF